MCAYSEVAEWYLNKFRETGVFEVHRLIPELTAARQFDIIHKMENCEHQDKLDEINTILGYHVDFP